MKTNSKIGTWGIDDRGYHFWKLTRGGRGAKPVVIKRKSLADLKTAVEARIAELSEKGSVGQVSTEPTVRQKLTRWLEHRVKPYREESTYESYLETCTNHIFPEIGKVKVSKLTTDHVQKMVAAVLAKGLSNRTAIYSTTVLFAGLGRKKAMELKEDLELPQAPEPRDRALDEEEIVAVLEELFRKTVVKIPRKGSRLQPGDELHHYRDRFLIALLLNSGLRVSEALGLLRLKVNLSTGEVHVTEQLRRSKKNDPKDRAERADWKLKKLKRPASRRIVHLNPEAVEIVRGQIAMVEAEKKLAGPGYEDNGLLFPTESGRPGSARNVLRSLERVIKRIGIEHATIHDCRRSYLTHLAAVEEHMQVVAAIAGHSSIHTTFKVYVKAKELNKKRAAQKVGFGIRRGVS